MLSLQRRARTRVQRVFKAYYPGSQASRVEDYRMSSMYDRSGFRYSRKTLLLSKACGASRNCSYATKRRAHKQWPEKQAHVVEIG